MNVPISSLLLALTLLSALTPSCSPAGPRTRALDGGAAETTFTLPTRRAADSAARAADLRLTVSPGGRIALLIGERPPLSLSSEEARALAETLESFDAWASAKENRGLNLVREAARLGGDCGSVDVLYLAIPEGERRVALRFRFSPVVGAEPATGETVADPVEVLLGRSQARSMAAALRPPEALNHP